MPSYQMLIFATIVTAILGLAHLYVSRRLFRDPKWSPRWAKIGTWTIWSLMVLMIAAMMLTRQVPRATITPFAWLSYAWMGTFWYLFVLLIVGDLGLWAYGISQRLRKRPIDTARRTFFARALASFAGAGATGVAAVGVRNAVNGLEVKPVEVWLPALDPAFDGYTIVQLSDVHVGPTIGATFIQDLVDRVNAEKPSLVAITGDLVDGNVTELGKHVAPLGGLVARDGTYFVTGNHEYFSGVRPWIEFLSSLKIKVLRNECVDLPGFCLAGVDDSTAQRYDQEHGEDVAAAVRNAVPGKPKILLAHQPRAVFAAAEHGIDLQLSGHTHGGQLFPFALFVMLQQPYVAGLCRHDNMQIYVSCGTGWWGPPMRVGAPSEITKITLRAGRAPDGVRA